MATHSSWVGDADVLERSVGDMTGADTLEWVAEQGPVSVTDLMVAADITRSACAHMLRELWVRGLVVRAWGFQNQPCRVYAVQDQTTSDRAWEHVDDADTDDAPVWARVQADS